MAKKTVGAAAAAAKKTALKRRFWQCRRDLPSVIWNPRKSKAAVRFKHGTAVVQDEAMAKRLAEMGYIEVPMECEHQPTPCDDSMPIVGLSTTGALKAAPKPIVQDVELRDLDLDTVPDALYG